MRILELVEVNCRRRQVNGTLQHRNYSSLEDFFLGVGVIPNYCFDMRSPPSSFKT